MQPKITKTPIDIQTLPDVVCLDCGCKFFDKRTLVKSVSALQSNSGHPENLTIDVLVCAECKTPLGQKSPKA